MTTNKIIDLFKKSSAYDKKHINNLSKKKVPAALLAMVEQGCSYEALEQLAKGFPICKYQTQITVHGIFDDLHTRCIGGYVNLTKNKNQSLGIRWNAIDHDKKARLFSDIKMVDSEWIIRKDSTAFYLQKMVRASSKEEYQKQLQAYKDEAAKIDTSLFTGTVSAYGLQGLWGTVYAVLTLNIQCYPAENHMAIFENVTGKTADDLAEAVHAKMKQEAEEEAAWKKEQEEAAAKREKAQQERQKKLEAWKAKNPVPSCFYLVEDHTFQPGDVECFGTYFKDGTFHYKYRVYYKSFGRLCYALCDINGKKLGKGSEVWCATAKAYIKKAA